MNRSIVASAALLGWLAACGTSDDAGPAPASPAHTPIDLSGVQASLDRIERRLDALEMTAPEPRELAAPSSAVPPTVASGDDPAGSELLQLTAEVRALRAALEDHLADDASDVSPGMRGLAELKAEHPEANWKALNRLIHTWNIDEDAAREDVLLMTCRDTVKTYGAPDNVWGGKGGLHWLYFDAKDPVTGEASTEVWIFFTDGIATDMGIKQP